MRLSLSVRLALLLLAALVCVLVPALVITYTHVGESALRADRQNFTATLRVVEENIHAGFLHLNESKLSGVMQAKDRLRGAARRFALLLAQPEGESPEQVSSLNRLRRQYQRENEKEGLWVDSFYPASLRQSPQTSLGLKPDMTDFKGTKLADTLAALTQAGAHGIYRLPGRGPTLIYFLPVRGRVVIAAIFIQALEREAHNAISALVHSLKNRFETLSLYQGGFVALIDKQGTILASRGEIGTEELAAVSPLFAQTGRLSDAPVETVLRVRRGHKEEEYLVAWNFSRPFQWFTVMAAPLHEISAPSRSLLQRLTGQSLGLGLVVMLLSLCLLQRTVRPLRLLLPKIKDLPDTDFSSPEAVEALSRDLPMQRLDEAGDLARSFAAMAEQLSRNIRARLEASALEERLRGELDAAREIQRGILPPPDLSPNIFGLSSSAMLEPAREVGGDLYYFFTLPDGRHAFVIGDVSGKGVPAALFMAITVTLSRHALAEAGNPGAAMGKINSLLEAHNPQTMFVTLFLAVYDPQSGRIDYANGGHNPPLLARDSKVEPLEGLSGPALGVVPGVEYQGFSRVLRENELCLLYTDGVTEAVNENRDMYEEERLLEYLRRHGHEHPRQVLTGIFEDVKRFRGEAAPFDDITMLAFARK